MGEVQDALARLDQRSNDFVILECTASEYVQANGATVEFHLNNRQQRAIGPVDRRIRQRVFEAFHSGTRDLEALAEWVDASDEMGRSPRRSAGFGWLLAVIAIVAFAAYSLIQK